MVDFELNPVHESNCLLTQNTSELKVFARVVWKKESEEEKTDENRGNGLANTNWQKEIYQTVLNRQETEG